MTNQTDFPIPADFPPFAQWDKLHCPRPLTPLEHETLLKSTEYGFTKAILEMGSPIGAMTLSVNYYNYLTAYPVDPQGETGEARAARYKKNVEEFMPVLGERWEKEWLPAIKQTVLRRRAQDYSAMSDADLLRTWDEMMEEVKERWYIHGMLLYGFYYAGVFADFYKQATGGDEKEGYEALQGFDTEALASSRGMWKLSRTVRNNPELKALFESSTSTELPAKLNASEAGRSFMKDLDTYLQDFGWRADSVYELTRPSWREDPSIALNSIQGYLSIGDESGPEVQFASAVKRREELLANARSALANDPEKLKRFEDLYAWNKCFTPIVEDHNHWIDQMGDITMRYPALEMGKRLAAKGVLAKAEDAFLLNRAELGEAFGGKDFKAVAAERAAEIERFAKVVPPLFIGTPPPPDGDPIVDVIVRFFGVPVEPSTDPAVLTGIAASPGTARGPAKVVRDLNEASKLQSGDVLVCEMTLPPWTPLFSTACAVVADTGGILSHCAIVAREYRIPCVVGTGNGTSVIKDGMMITVDGSKGVIRIE
jgi:pyruvate,water dikinase